MGSELVLVLDNGSPYVQQVVKRLRDSKVNCLVRPGTLDREQILALHPDRVIIAGTPACAEDGELCSSACDPLRMGLPTQCIR